MAFKSIFMFDTILEQVCATIEAEHVKLQPVQTRKALCNDHTTIREVTYAPEYNSINGRNSKTGT